MRSTALAFLLLLSPALHAADPVAFLDQHCVECHDADLKKGGLDLTALETDFADGRSFATWVKVLGFTEWLEAHESLVFDPVSIPWNDLPIATRPKGLMSCRPCATKCEALGVTCRTTTSYSRALDGDTAARRTLWHRGSPGGRGAEDRAGAEVAYADRAEIAKIVERTEAGGHGLRAMIHELAASPLFHPPAR